jgi:hypothetical protein
MTAGSTTVGGVADVSTDSGSAFVRISRLPAGVVRPHHQVEAVLVQSMAEMGTRGRVWQAWRWVLNGDQPSPVTLTPPLGQAPSREQILAEADAGPAGSTAPPGVPTDFCDQIGEVRRLLRWLAGASDDIPVDGDERGQFVGARGDYARTDEEIRQVRDLALRGLETFDLPGPMDPADARNPWLWDPAWMNAAWLRGVRDLLNWVLGDEHVSPLRNRLAVWPPLDYLAYEDEAAEEIARQGHPGGEPVDPEDHPPQYGEAIQATIRWLRGEDTTPPVGRNGCGTYAS